MTASVKSLAAVRAAISDYRPAQTIQCPCCGADTGVAICTGRELLPEQQALRNRMRLAGLTLKAIRFWTSARKG